MTETISVLVNGHRVTVPRGTLVAVAIELARPVFLRRSVSGQPRGLLCGMGVCFECRVSVNGQPHVRSCQCLCEEGMEIRTDA